MVGYPRLRKAPEGAAMARDVVVMAPKSLEL